MNKINLFVEDISLENNTTELDDLYIQTTDVLAWPVWLEGDYWPKNSRGYNISFQDKEGNGFHLELNEEGMQELFRLVRDALELEALHKRVMNDV